MLQKDCFYTYLEKEEKNGVFSHYELFYTIELSSNLVAKSFNVKPTLGSNPTLQKTGTNTYELIGWEDKVPNNLCVIQLNTVVGSGQHQVPLTGSIKIQVPQGGGKFTVRRRWEKIGIIIEHDHPPQNHDGSSTSHLGDAD